MIKSLTLKQDVCEALDKATIKKGVTKTKILIEALDYFDLFYKSCEVSNPRLPNSTKNQSVVSVKNLRLPEKMIYAAKNYGLSLSKFTDLVLRFFLLNETQVSIRKHYEHSDSYNALKFG